MYTGPYLIHSHLDAEGTFLFFGIISIINGFICMIIMKETKNLSQK